MSRPGHRRVRRSDVAAFRDHSRSERALALADMCAAALEGGLYGIGFAKEA